jgi:hypothetical protein
MQIARHSHHIKLQFKTILNNLFNGTEQKDSTLIKSVMHRTIKTQTVSYNAAGKAVLEGNKVQEFL